MTKAISPKEQGRMREQSIIAMLNTAPMTIAEIAEQQKVTISSIHIYMKRMREASPKRVYIKEWRSNTGIYAGRPAPVYAAGSLPDLEFVPLRRPTPKYSAEHRKAQILELLSKRPMSSIQVAEKMYLCRDNILFYITQMRRNGVVYIKRWLDPRLSNSGRGGSWTPIYAVGAKQDAPRPTKESSKDRHARRAKDPAYMEEQRARRKLRYQIEKLRKKPQGIFAALGI